MAGRGGGQRPANGKAQVVAALQAALAAEEAAAYGYGIVGAHLRAASALGAEAIRCWLVHQRARDQLEQLIFAAGGTPSPAAVAYRLPWPVSTERQARALAARLEDNAIAAYLGMVALGSRQLRELGATQMQQSAIRAVHWNGRQQAFPGLPAAAVRTADRGRQAPAQHG
jgi:hypothetical protein